MVETIDTTEMNILFKISLKQFSQLKSTWNKNILIKKIVWTIGLLWFFLPKYGKLRKNIEKNPSHVFLSFFSHCVLEIQRSSTTKQLLQMMHIFSSHFSPSFLLTESRNLIQSLLYSVYTLRELRTVHRCVESLMKSHLNLNPPAVFSRFFQL